MSTATTKAPPSFDDETDPEGHVEGEPTRLLRRLREERRLSDAALDVAARTASDIAVAARRSSGTLPLRPRSKE